MFNRKVKMWKKSQTKKCIFMALLPPICCTLYEVSAEKRSLYSPKGWFAVVIAAATTNYGHLFTSSTFKYGSINTKQQKIHSNKQNSFHISLSVHFYEIFQFFPHNYEEEFNFWSIKITKFWFWSDQIWAKNWLRANFGFVMLLIWQNFAIYNNNVQWAEDDSFLLFPFPKIPVEIEAILRWRYSTRKRQSPVELAGD